MNIEWIRLNSEKDDLKKWDKIHFILDGFEEEVRTGYYDGNLFWNLDEAYCEDIVTHYALITIPIFNK